MKSLISNEKVCYVCGTTLDIHKHHIFYGRNRKNSDLDGCWLWLCARHHNMSDEGIHFNKELDTKIKMLCEKQWIEYYKKTQEDFINRYRINYL